MDKHNEEHIYVAIDLKSFYASVECRERGKDALTTNLVVADPTRTEKTICLAVSPALKAYGIPGRARLFEVVQRVKEVNKLRLSKLMASGHAAGTVERMSVRRLSKPQRLMCRRNAVFWRKLCGNPDFQW